MPGLIIELGEDIKTTKVYINGKRIEGIRSINIQLSDKLYLHPQISLVIKGDGETKKEVLKDISEQAFGKGIVFPFRMEKQATIATLYIHEDPSDWQCPKCKDKTEHIWPYRCKCGCLDARAYDYR